MHSFEGHLILRSKFATNRQSHQLLPLSVGELGNPPTNLNVYEFPNHQDSITNTFLHQCDHNKSKSVNWTGQHTQAPVLLHREFIIVRDIATRTRTLGNGRGDEKSELELPTR